MIVNKTPGTAILDKTIAFDYTQIICLTCTYLIKHQNRPLNLPRRPQNSVESVRNENNIDRCGRKGEVSSM